MSLASPVMAEPTDLGAILKAYNDVTARLMRSHDLLGREVRRLRGELQEKDKELQRRERLAALGEMAAGVAHEIRNPLGGIGLYASLLERDVADRGDQLELVRRIRSGVRNLESVVGDILAFAGKAEPHRRLVRIGAVLDGVLTHAAPRAQTVGAELFVEAAGQSLELSCDPLQMERALLNLVLNALDAAATGGRVWIRASETGDGAVAIAVEDDGPGIDTEVLPRIFDPFFTTKDSGTGLGLAIVHRIVELHGGRITAGNRGPRGAVFVLTIPAASQKEPDSRMEVISWPKCA